MSIADRIKVRSVKTLADDWFVLRKTTLDYRRAAGDWQTINRETYDRGNGAVILLYDPGRRTVVLTRQFRYPAFVNGHDDLLIEAPAGLLDMASPEARIRAEVEEETGYRIEEITPLWDVFMSPGSVTERLFFFLGRYAPKDRQGEGGGEIEEGEDIEVLELPFDEAMAMVAAGRIRDAKTIMLLQHAALHLFGPAAGTGRPARDEGSKNPDI